MSPNINSRLALSGCTPPELIHMFARLAASHSSRTSPTKDDAVNDTISELNNCLNFKGKGNESPVRVLDAALSLLHFKTPQVYDTTAGFTVETIIELLSSLVACRVFNLNKEEALLVGSSMPTFDCVQLAEACNGVIGALEKRGMVSETQKIVYGVARMSVSAPCYWHTLPSVVACDMRSVCVKTKVSTKLLHCLQQDTNDLPLRLMWWYLDPLLLKHDVLEILEDALKRPFLCLNKAFRERMDWQSVIRCLALSPIMFIEIRSLLHCWFLET
uniref:Uncharacterized protein n=1 Tax=Kalanchoe fedtschenkoi TaxID=63787 RepID=A0A7N1A7W3_KALFE